MALSASAQKVEDWLAARDAAGRVVEMPDSTRTSQQAAAAIGCSVAQIAKTLVFCGRKSGRPVLVVASGINRVSESKLAGLCGEEVRRADADLVRSATGYVIGGVPPVAQATAIDTFIDADLMALDPIWAAAGTPFSVFRLTAPELLSLSGGRVADIKQ